MKAGDFYMKKGYLVLANGMVFEGERFGADVPCKGELVFTTGVTGYGETLSDPSFCGQIITQTFPLIGNYGINPEDFEGECAAAGYIVREACDSPSNFRSCGSLDQYLKRVGVPGLKGVETRDVTRAIRSEGAMAAMIADEIPADIGAALRDALPTRPVERVSGKAEAFQAEGGERYRVAMIDYGAKRGIGMALSKRGCTVIPVAWDATAERILALRPDGVLLSNGPGDPRENPFAIRQIEKLAGKTPMFGICLGHQLLAMALGARTEKMKFGHRGSNQPVRDLIGGRTYITSQNHGYALVSESLEGVGITRFVNANDGTCEGVDYPALRSFGVQFHPEARSGPEDTAFLFDRFLSMMEVGVGSHADR